MGTFIGHLFIIVATISGLLLLLVAPKRTTILLPMLGLGYLGSAEGLIGTVLGLAAGAGIGGLVVGIAIWARSVWREMKASNGLAERAIVAALSSPYLYLAAITGGAYWWMMSAGWTRAAEIGLAIGAFWVSMLLLDERTKKRSEVIEFAITGAVLVGIGALLWALNNQSEVAPWVGGFGGMGLLVALKGDVASESEQKSEVK